VDLPEPETPVTDHQAPSGHVDVDVVEVVQVGAAEAAGGLPSAHPRPPRGRERSIGLRLLPFTGEVGSRHGIARRGLAVTTRGCSGCFIACSR
jgi:hypothetical protein